MGVLTGLTRTLSRCNYTISSVTSCGTYCLAYLITCLAVEQDPADLNNFGRIFRHIYTMFIAGGCHMDDHISVQLRGCWSSRWWNGSHIVTNVQLIYRQGGISVNEDSASLTMLTVLHVSSVRSIIIGPHTVAEEAH